MQFNFDQDKYSSHTLREVRHTSALSTSHQVHADVWHRMTRLDQFDVNTSVKRCVRQCMGSKERGGEFSEVQGLGKVQVG